MTRANKRRIERLRLFEIVNRKELYCTKHELFINPQRFWAKRCYMGRSENGCRYVEVRNG